MSSDVQAALTMLEMEVGRLEAELRQHPTFRKLEAVRGSLKALNSAYGGVMADVLTDADARPAPSVTKAENRTDASAVPVRRVGSVSGVVGDLAEAWFDSTGRRAKSPAIVEFVASQGIRIRGRKPTGVVASILSHDGRFDNAADRHGVGYGLKAWAKQDLPSASNEDARPALDERTASVHSPSVGDQDQHAARDAEVADIKLNNLEETKAAGRDDALAA